MIDLSLRVAAIAVSMTVGLAAFTWLSHHEFEKGDAHGADRVQAQWDAERAQRQQVVVQRQAQVITQDRAEDEKAQKVESHVQDQSRTVAVAVARAVAERDGLQHELDQVRADALSEATTRARLAAEAAAASDSLGQCSASYSAVARERDELAIQVGGLLPLLDAGMPVSPEPSQQGEADELR